MAARAPLLRLGVPVTFTAIVEFPENTGKIVEANWDFEGDGSFPVNREVQTLLTKQAPGQR